MNFDLAKTAIKDVLETVRGIDVMPEADMKYLEEHKEHIAKVFQNTQIWRTDTQKQSIISDVYHPTVHGKFHQAILEQKVQADQLFVLAKDFELKKLDIEEKLLDLKDLKETPRDIIKGRRLEVELKYMHYELKQMQIAVKYRMDEIKGWKVIQDELLEQMKEMPEDYIWSKNAGETEDMFFKFLTNMQGLRNTTDAGEYRNLLALATFAVKQAKTSGLFSELKARCDDRQLDSLFFLGEISKEEIKSIQYKRNIHAKN
jgi:hypothetical protein